jgi:hypothetical protein
MLLVSSKYTTREEQDQGNHGKTSHKRQTTKQKKGGKNREIKLIVCKTMILNTTKVSIFAIPQVVKSCDDTPLHHARKSRTFVIS